MKPYGIIYNYLIENGNAQIVEQIMTGIRMQESILRITD